MVTNGLGTKIKLDENAIANLTEISGLEVSADTVDVTTLDSEDGYREFVGGLKDGGEVGISGFFNPETGKGQVEFLEALDTGAVKNFIIEFPTSIGKKWIFKGIVTAFTTGVSLEDPLSFEGSIKVTGKPTLAPLT
ncbi:phage tail tube protein [Clostridium tertium]|uniref:phage tail tube protein n=1 Tax=Clostridium tertium TaxID=1559 RepID=UPI00232F9624|nr:phage tail tube protein [Clostridium tertium]MDB1924060.1 phage tail tube protein [Clostridium tertium]MDB1927179.1 phage tail tube protein [Clostridium tertium]MDB1930956.1 phage tail tube protein [Clostridium tertium]